MYKKVLIALLTLTLSISLAACGGAGANNSNSNTTEEQQTSEGLFSAVGGWKEEQLGVVWIINSDGTGYMINELNYGDSESSNLLPSVLSSAITWEEDEETVKVKTEAGDYTLQKKKEGGVESLDLSGVSYVRLSDSEVSDYKEKAEATSSGGSSSADAEFDPTVETIDLSFDEGTIKYVGFEKANDQLTDEDNAYVFLFDFTNNQSKPSQVQSVFRIQFFQNGKELNSMVAYSSTGGDQYEVVNAFYNDVLKGGTNTFGQIAVIEDNSPVTIMASYNGFGSSKDEYQMMEVDISDSNSAGAGTEAEATASDGPVKETDYMTIEGVYADSSYSSEYNPNCLFLYVVYSAHSPAENLNVDSKSMVVTINDMNSYSAVRSNSEVRYMRNYSNSASLQKVNIGDTVKFVETFEVPKAELEPGRSIRLTKSQIPQTEKILLSTDDIVFCENPEEVAKVADPEGYELESWALQDASGEVVAAVKNEINGYQWDVYVSPLSYNIEFWDPNNYELRTSINTSGGTYVVKNGYIICTNEIGGTLEIPFTYENGKADVDITAAFDYMN